MEQKTYYMSLGVSSSESPSGIRAAYRELAKRLHPDVAGAQATSTFQAVTEAYGVLSDPQRRREYNDALKRAAEGGGGGEHLGRGPSVLREPVTILGEPDGIRPSFEAVRDRFLRNFTGIGVPKSEQLEGLDFQVLLTPDEYCRGCIVPVGVPVFSRCPRCNGSGRDWLFPCAYCQQQGMVEQEARLHVRIPPTPPLGCVYEIPLRSLRIQNFCLRLHVFLEAGAG